MFDQIILLDLEIKNYEGLKRLERFRNNDIYLKEDTHEYLLNSQEQIVFTSCTTFVKYFFEPFDRIGIANNLVSSYPNYLGMDPQDLVRNWEQTAIKGTEVHKELENYILHNVKPTSLKALSGYEWYKKNIEILALEVFPEVILFSKELRLAGTADLILFNNYDNTCEIYDWKTSKKVESNSYNNKMGVATATQHLMDCNLNHYSLQLSLYRYILEKYYNVEVKKQTIIHLTDNGVTTYNCKYFKDEIVKMLNSDLPVLKNNHDNKLTNKFVLPDCF